MAGTGVVGDVWGGPGALLVRLVGVRVGVLVVGRLTLIITVVGVG